MIFHDILKLAASYQLHISKATFTKEVATNDLMVVRDMPYSANSWKS